MALWFGLDLSEMHREWLAEMIGKLNDDIQSKIQSDYGKNILDILSAVTETICVVFVFTDNQRNLTLDIQQEFIDQEYPQPVLHFSFIVPRYHVQIKIIILTEEDDDPPDRNLRILRANTQFYPFHMIQRNPRNRISVIRFS